MRDRAKAVVGQERPVDDVAWIVDNCYRPVDGQAQSRRVGELLLDWKTEIGVSKRDPLKDEDSS
jgi:hypothetical protein